MTPDEQEFSNRLKSVGADADALVIHTFQELVFNQIAGAHPDVFSAVNQHAGFFNAMLGGHQTACFAALHRLYETDGNNNTLASLLGFAQMHREMFTRAALVRRRRERGMAEAVAETFTAECFVPDATGFAEMRAKLAEMRTLYQANAEKIRHTIFAHSARQPLAERIQQFDNLMKRDLERMAVFPHVMHGMLSSLFRDGRRPDVTMPVTNVVQVTNDPPPEGQGHFLHFNVARTTRDFLRDYTRMMQRDDEEGAA